LKELYLFTRDPRVRKSSNGKTEKTEKNGKRRGHPFKTVVHSQFGLTPKYKKNYKKCIFLTCAAMLYSSMRGSLVKWNCSGSSVEMETFRPLAK
jgi:hypothetical protein